MKKKVSKKLGKCRDYSDYNNALSIKVVNVL